jgi:hypothetical protein
MCLFSAAGNQRHSPDILNQINADHKLQFFLSKVRFDFIFVKTFESPKYYLSVNY